MIFNSTLHNERGKVKMSQITCISPKEKPIRNRHFRCRGLKRSFTLCVRKIRDYPPKMNRLAPRIKLFILGLRKLHLNYT